MKFIFIEYLFILLLCCLWTTVDGLECYACHYQDGNRDKCVKTSKQCEEHQDVCMTEIKWGLPPYWIPYGTRMNFITKDCDTGPNCERRKQEMMKHCKRDWFDDWNCIECCFGDLCNYYATMGSSFTRPSQLVIFISLITAVLLWLRQ